MSAAPAARIVLATRNPGKVREIVAVYAHLPIRWLSLADFPHVKSAPETGATYDDNAVEKARSAAAACALPALADDSGVEIDALEGRPGVRSARFLGPGATDAERNARILELLRDVPDAGRGARYRAVIAVALPEGGRVRIFEAVCEGRVARAARGSGGFGYDPLFVPDGYAATMAELTAEMKNEISHRGRALRAAEPWVAEVAAACLQDRGSASAK